MRLRKSLIQLYFFAFICAVLSGCGGSESNNDKTQPAPTLTFSLTNTDISLAENSTIEVPLNASYSGNEAIDYSAQVIEGDSKLIAISLNKNTMILSANEVSTSSRFKINVTASAADRSKTIQLTVDVTTNLATVYQLNLSDDAGSHHVSQEQKRLNINLLEHTDSSKFAHYTFSTSPKISAITASVAEQVLTIAIGDLENDVTTTLTVTGTVDGLSDTLKIDLALTNTSGQDVLRESTLWLDENATQFDDFTRVAPRYAQAAYLSGNLSTSGKQQLMNDFNAAVAEAKALTTSEINQELADASASYQAKAITETTFLQVLQQYKNALQQASSQIIIALNAIAKQDDSLPTIPHSPYQYIEQYQAFSAVVSHSQLGSFQDNNWVFSGSYQFLNQLVPVLNTPSACHVE